MKTLAIIAEYNPFHNGHLYHLNKAKEITDANNTIAIMSGNFLQRGVPAMWDKYTRSKMATLSGLDLVLELPFVYASGSAMDFAMGAVSILDKLNSVDYLCFGAESEDMNLFDEVSDIIINEPDSYKSTLANALAKGISFPQARAKALEISLKTTDTKAFQCISQPNNILAIEYICALKRIGSKIKPIVIKRHNAMYHDNTLYGSISSASAIRTGIEETNFNIEKIKADLPSEVVQLIQNSYLHSWPIYCDELTPYIQDKLINPINYGEICDISEDMANKLSKINPVTNYQDAIKALSSKDLTVTRISRSLIHLLLDYKEFHRRLFIENDYAMYANILSFRKDNSQLIKKINKHADIPLITKKADFVKYISDYSETFQNIASIMWNYDTKATNLYNCLVYNRYKEILPNDYNIQLPII